MPILRLIGELGLDTSGFQKGSDKAKKDANTLGSVLKRTLAGAFSTVAVTAYVRSIFDMVGHIKDAADQFRLTTDEVQKLDYAARENGLTIEKMGSVMDKVSDARANALAGDKKAIDAFATLGVTMAQLGDEALRDIKLLEMLGVAVKNAGNSSEALAAFRDLGGKGSARLIDSLTKLQDLDGKLSLVSPEELERLDQAAIKLDLLWLKLKALAARGISFGMETSVYEAYQRGGLFAQGEGGAGQAAKMPTNISDRLKIRPPDTKPAEPAAPEEKPVLLDEELKTAQEIYRALQEVEYIRSGSATKRLALEREINHLTIQSAEIPEDHRIALELLQKQKELAELEAAPATEASRLLSFRNPDQLSRIGGLTGATGVTDRTPKEMAMSLKSIDRKLTSGIKIKDV